MKYIILTSLLILFCSSIKAQLNQSPSHTREIMSNDNNWIFDKSGQNKGSITYLLYRSKEKNQTKTFYFKTDSCCAIMLRIPNDQLNDVVEDMKSRFISKGGYMWFNYKNKITYAIVIKDNSAFFELYELNENSKVFVR